MRWVPDDCISTPIPALSAPSSGGSALKSAPFSIPAREGSDEICRKKLKTNRLR